MRKDTNFNIMVTMITVSTFLAVGYIFFIYRVYVSFNQTGSALTTLSINIGREKRTDAIEKTMNNINSQAQLVNTYFIGSGVSDVANFLAVLERVGSQSKAVMKVNSINEEKTVDSSVDTLKTVRLSLTAEGDWTAIYRTLKLLEYLPYKTDIIKTQISSNGKIGELGSFAPTNEWIINMDMRIYVNA